MKSLFVFLMLTLSLQAFASSNKVVFCEILEVGDEEVQLATGKLVINTNSDLMARIDSKKSIRVTVRDRFSSNLVNVVVLLGVKAAVSTGDISSSKLIMYRMTNVSLPFSTSIFADRQEYEVNCKR